MPKDVEIAKRKKQRAAWDSLYGVTPECKASLLETKNAFKAYFPEGHITRISTLITELSDMARAGETFEDLFDGCEDVHPRAWDIILKHGKHYTPQSWVQDKPWEWDWQPLSGSCFLNSIEFLWFVREIQPKSRLTYVEGICIGPWVDPMLHAWNGIGFSGKTLDWTFYAHTMFNRYFGVPFTLEEYRYINQSGDDFNVTMMFRRDNFERVEQKVLEVLQKPRTRLMRPKG